MSQKKKKRENQARLDVWLQKTVKEKLAEDAKRMEVSVSQYVRSIIKFMSNLEI